MRGSSWLQAMRCPASSDGWWQLWMSRATGVRRCSVSCEYCMAFICLKGYI
jgi:hypothetical protein